MHRRHQHVIEVLYRQGCPFFLLAVDRVRAAIAEAALEDFELRIVRVDSMEDAVRRRLPGSPSVRVDGEDVEPALGERPIGTHGRGYFEGGEIHRAPTEALIRSAIAAASRRADCSRRELHRRASFQPWNDPFGDRHETGGPARGICVGTKTVSSPSRAHQR